MPVGLSWSEEFVRQLDEREMRHAYMADQVRTRIALQIRALRDQAERRWSQVELGRRAGKPQNVISRIENPDYGQLTLQTLFDMAEAFDLPLYVDFPEWEDWLELMKDIDTRTLKRRSFQSSIGSWVLRGQSDRDPQLLQRRLRRLRAKHQLKRPVAPVCRRYLWHL